MSNANLLEFLRTLAARADLLASLKVKSKPEVIAIAGELGMPFTEPEFDDLIWALEIQLAERRGEPFDNRFPLWETMWGQYYLEYVVLDLMPSLEEAGIYPPRPAIART
jgi:hypothetical protein